jgi:hypothetical protein
MSTVQTPGTRTTPVAAEAQSGLDPWEKADLPDPPRPKGLGWLAVVGPGVIILGVSIGSGEFLLGPAAFVQFGLSLLWVTTAAVILQTLFNTEVMRYVLATGEPVFTGFMRTRPSSTLWAWIYTGLYILQVGWPGWAAASAGAIFFLFTQRLAAPEDATTIYLIGVTAFLLCVVVLSVGRRIERTLELVNWVLVATVLTGFLGLALLFVPAATWGAGIAGLVGFDTATGSFNLLPAGVDFFLLGALVAYSGAGGVTNVTLANWARDKGYGMGQRAGYIPAAIGGQKVNLAHNGFTFDPTTESMSRWSGWWRIIRADQWGVFAGGALLGMLLPGIIYVTFLTPGTNIQGLGISAALAEGVGARAGVMAGLAIAFLGAWILFKTQLDQLEGMVRAITDILWTGSSRVRAWRGGDVRKIYYFVLGVVVIWGLIALRLAQPLFLLLLGANVAAINFIFTSLHLLYINTRLLPEHVRPPMWRRAALVVMAIFYGFFVTLSMSSLLSGA